MTLRVILLRIIATRPSYISSRGEARQKIAWCTAATNKLKRKVYMLVWAVFEPEIVSHGALPLDLPGAYSKI
jgi:hypothetical protein